MTKLKCKTIGNSTPQGKSRVYFCCHPEDFNKYFESISDEILAMQNCAIWYADEVFARDEEFFAALKHMQLFVMPVTSNLLCNENETLDIEFKFAIENHIPVLPLMQEHGLDELFNKKCGDLQFLDKSYTDVTSISYDEKLNKYLESVLIGDEFAEKIRAAFDAYIFLSYRKKDRKYAQELMRLIHKNEFCRDIAIWYDEFLTPGENFNDSIKEALQKSSLFVLAVTPNIVNEQNYIMTTEYPMAQQEGKTILPAELVPTNREQLSEKYKDISDPADAYNETEFSEALLESVKKIAIKENDGSPEHNFFIGLAYLNGIDVEVDHERAVALITNAAESGLIEAVDKLYNMYLNGHGVDRNYDCATRWFRKKIDLLREKVEKNGSEENYAELIAEMDSLAQYYAKVFANNLEVKKINFDMVEICEDAYNKFKTLRFKRKLGLSYVRVAQSYMDEHQYELATQKVTEAEELYKNIKEDLCKEINDNLQTATIGQLLDYQMTHNDLAVLYEGLAEVAQSDGQLEKAEEYLLRCLEFRKETQKFFPGHTIPQINVTCSYLTLVNCYFLMGNVEKALEYYEIGYPLALEIANRTGILYAGEVAIRLHMIRARIFIAQNDIENAIKCYITNLCYLEASVLSPQMKKLKAENYYEASKQSYNIKKFEQATNFLIKYLYICKQTSGMKQYLEMFDRELDYFTECYIQSGNIGEAIKLRAEVLDEKRKAYRKIKSEATALIYSLGMMGLGDVCLRCKEYQQAKNAYTDILRFSEELKTNSNVKEEFRFSVSVNAYIKMAKMYEAMNRNSKVKKCFKQAIKISKTSVKRYRSDSAYRQLFGVYGKMGDWYKQEKQYKAAYKCYIEAIYLAEESVVVYQNEDDKSYLALLCLKAGALSIKKRDSLLKKSMVLWKELMENDPSSKDYQDGYNMVCKELNIDNNPYTEDLTENCTMTLTDENGNEESFELLDIIVEDDNEFAVFFPVDDADEDVLILRVEESDKEGDSTSYSMIDDELAAKIFEIFKERNKDNFNFIG